MKNLNNYRKARELNENELANVNGGFIGVLIGSFLASCAIGFALGLAIEHEYGEEDD